MRTFRKSFLQAGVLAGVRVRPPVWERGGGRQAIIPPVTVSGGVLVRAISHGGEEGERERAGDLQGDPSRG